MATDTKTTLEQVRSVSDGLECSPSKTQASSPIYGSKGGGGKKKMSKAEKPAKDKRY